MTTREELDKRNRELTLAVGAALGLAELHLNRDDGFIYYTRPPSAGGSISRFDPVHGVDTAIYIISSYQGLGKQVVLHVSRAGWSCHIHLPDEEVPYPLPTFKSIGLAVCEAVLQFEDRRRKDESIANKID